MKQKWKLIFKPFFSVSGVARTAETVFEIWIEKLQNCSDIDQEVAEISKDVF